MATVPGPGADAPCSLWQDWPAHNGAAQMVMGNKCSAAHATAPCLTCPAGAAGTDCKWVWLGKAKTFEDCRELATALQTLEHDGPTRRAICQTATWCRPDAAKPNEWDEARGPAHGSCDRARRWKSFSSPKDPRAPSWPPADRPAAPAEVEGKDRLTQARNPGRNCPDKYPDRTKLMVREVSNHKGKSREFPLRVPPVPLHGRKLQL